MVARPSPASPTFVKFSRVLPVACPPSITSISARRSVSQINAHVNGATLADKVCRGELARSKGNIRGAANRRVLAASLCSGAKVIVPAFSMVPVLDDIPVIVRFACSSQLVVPASPPPFPHSSSPPLPTAVFSAIAPDLTAKVTAVFQPGAHWLCQMQHQY